MPIIKDKLKARGRVYIELRGPDGKLKTRRVKNLVVTAGTSLIAALLRDKSPTLMTHMALGSGNTAAAAGQTALVSELGRVALTSTGGAANQVIYTATFGAGVATGSVVEAGLFNATPAGTMLCRTVFGVLTKGALDTITVTWTVTIAG